MQSSAIEGVKITSKDFKPLKKWKPKKVISKSVSELGKPDKQAVVVTRKAVLSNNKKRYGISNLKRK